MSQAQAVDQKVICEMLAKRKNIKTLLSVCASCGMCADSCFFYANRKEPAYMPSYKAINSLGKLYRKKGKVTRAELEEMADLVWNKCVLCTRCHCPVGISIPGMISWARSILRTQGITREYDKTGTTPDA